MNQQEDQINNQKLRQGEEQIRQLQQEILQKVIQSIDQAQEELENQCLRKNQEQKSKKDQKTINPYDQLKQKCNNLIQSTKDCIKNLQDHPKLEAELKRQYLTPTEKLKRLLSVIDPEWMSIKADDKFFNEKLRQTETIMQRCNDHLNQLRQVGCCGVGSVKKAIAAEFPKLTILVDNFWEAVRSMKLNAKEGIEYIVMQFQPQNLQNQIKQILQKMQVISVEKTKTKEVIKEKIKEVPGPVQYKTEIKYAEEKPDYIKDAYQKLYGLGEPQHISKGLELFDKQIRLNNQSSNQDVILQTKALSAQLGLGKVYYDKQIMPQDLNTSYQHYMIAFKQKNAEAYYRIGQFYETGEILNVDNREAKQMTRDQQLLKAVELYKQAAEISKNQHLDAVTDLGHIYEHGLPHDTELKNKVVKPDLKTAEQWYQYGVKQQFPRAMNNLGIVYQEQGHKKKALQLFRQATECQGGYARASYNLGICYQRGYGTNIDLKQARENYKKAYEKGDLYGKQSYAYFLLNDASVNDDIKGYRQVLQMLRSVLAEDKNMPESYYYLGYMYENGLGVSACPETSLEYYQTAVDMRLPKAINKMGEIHEFGIFNFVPDQRKAIEYYQAASDLNDDNAIVNMGRICEEEETEEGYKKAYDWYKKAARHGSHSGQTAIGELYRHGKGVDKDENLAIEYLKQGAERDGNARYLLEQLTTRITLDQINLQGLQGSHYGALESDRIKQFQSPQQSTIYKSQITRQ